MRFSQRIGKMPEAKPIQLEFIDDDLKNSLWNAIQIYFIEPYDDSRFNAFASLLYFSFYKQPLDQMPEFKSSIVRKIRDYYYSSEWYEVYDFLEFIAGLDPDTFNIEDFKQLCNEVFELEFSGYRFIDGQICAISNPNEKYEIEEAIERTKQFTPLKGANIHLHFALEKLSDKIKPDYRNSIKESISAIESIAKVIAKSEKGTLGSALEQIKSKIGMHSALEKGYKQIYGYTSDEGGIRHALMDDPACDFDDAKYMLVSCSAFANYLISKAEKAGEL